MTDYDKLYAEFHHNLLLQLISAASKSHPFNQDNLSEDDTEFLLQLNELASLSGQTLLVQGQYCICRIVSTYSHLMPLVPRDLMWFFGGDCLHFMPDEEIAAFQRLEDLREESSINNEEGSYEELRARALGLH